MLASFAAAALVAVAGLTQVQASAVRGLPEISALVASRDGRTVYAAGGVGSLGRVVRLARSPSGKVARVGPAVQVETPSGLALSPDRKTLYVTARHGRSVMMLSLALGFLARVRGFSQPEAVAVSPDGRDVYVAEGRGVILLLRDGIRPEGRQLAPPVGLPQGRGVAVSPDGRYVYETAGGGAHGAVAWFARDPGSGRLTQLGCIAQAFGFPNDCLPGRGLQQASGIIVSGRDVYVASTVSNAVARFTRGGDGALTEARSVSGKRTLLATSVAVDRDRVYVAAKGGLSVFSRDLSRRLGTVPGNSLALALFGRDAYVGGKGIRVLVRAR